MNETTTTQAPTIQQAVRAIAGRCDGAVTDDGMGFNGRDTSFGRSLARLPSDDWSERQLAAAHRMLRTYRTQLAGVGIEYDAIRAPAAEAEVQRAAWQARRAAAQAPAAATPAAAPKARGKVQRDPARKDRVLLTFPYDARLVAGLKAAGLKAFKEGETWFWPVWQDKAAAVAPLLEGFEGFDLLGVTIEAAKAAQAQKAELSVMSRAESGAIDIPGLAKGMKLYPFQAGGVAYALKAERTWIADEMGLGKTPEGLATVEAAGAYPAVFVVPASLKLNWLAEATKWLPGRRFEVLDGRDARPSGTADAYIVNYDLLRATKEKEGNRFVYRAEGLTAALVKLGLKAVVADESHYLKNRQAKRAHAVKALVEGVKYVLLLSGTPLKNRPEELIFQLDILGRLGEFGGRMKFGIRYCAATQGRWGWDFTGSSNLDELNAKLRSMCYVRRLKVEVLPELPPLRKIVVRLPIDNEAEYRRAENDFIAWLRATAGNAKANAASRAEQLVRVGGLRQLAVKGKLAAIKEWVESGFIEQDKKLVLFAHHIAAQNDLAATFNAPTIQGGATREAVEAGKKEFNQGAAPVIVCSLLAGGVGHTLHADGKCSSVALGELGWTPADVEQAAARVHRIGQTAESVDAYWLIGIGTIDEDMAEMLAAKQATFEAAADGEKARIAGESIEDAILAKYKAMAGV
jgi:SWI/SNF-related matrix-associated actin-dependent regulator 1 of chromatin subfamily A